MRKNTTLTRLKPFLLISLLTLFLGYTSMVNASLSSAPTKLNHIKIVAKSATPKQIKQQISRKTAKVAPHNQSSSISNQASQKVNQIYRKWAGTHYRLGGTGAGGIDCSAFVQKTMSSAFNIHLPRSTAEQRYSGRAISKSDLRPGDLVFFRKNHHVGVYIGGGKFIHASSSKGVTTSSLSERYWAKTYTQSRRVL